MEVEWDGVRAQCPYCAHLTDRMYRNEMMYLLVTSEMLKVSLSYLIGSSWAHLPDFILIVFVIINKLKLTSFI